MTRETGAVHFWSSVGLLWSNFWDTFPDVSHFSVVVCRVRWEGGKRGRETFFCSPFPSPPAPATVLVTIPPCSRVPLPCLLPRRLAGIEEKCHHNFFLKLILRFSTSLTQARLSTCIELVIVYHLHGQTATSFSGSLSIGTGRREPWERGWGRPVGSWFG